IIPDRAASVRVGLWIILYLGFASEGDIPGEFPFTRISIALTNLQFHNRCVAAVFSFWEDNELNCFVVLNLHGSCDRCVGDIRQELRSAIYGAFPADADTRLGGRVDGDAPFRQRDARE